MNQTDEINSIVKRLGIAITFPIRDQKVSRKQVRALVQGAPIVFNDLSEPNKRIGASNYVSGVTEGINKSDRKLWPDMEQAFISAPGRIAKDQIAFWFLNTFDGKQESLDFLLNMLRVDESDAVRNFIPLFIRHSSQEQWDAFANLINRERDLEMARNVINNLDDARGLNFWLPC